MAPEKVDIEEAEELANLLAKSFRSLQENEDIDDVFRSVLNGNSVFILKSEDSKLYAYYPCKNLARL